MNFKTVKCQAKHDFFNFVIHFSRRLIFKSTQDKQMKFGELY